MVDFNNPWRVVLVLAFVVLFTPLMGMLPGLPFLLFPLRAEEPLAYPDGVEFGKSSEGYVMAAWDGGDWDRPTACPVTVHVSGVDYDPARLASPARLRRDGWEEQIFECPTGTETWRSLWSPDDILSCSYRNGRLTHMTVHAGRTGAPAGVAVSVNGRRVDLPCTREAIIQALGPPLPAKSP